MSCAILCAERSIDPRDVSGVDDCDSRKALCLHGGGREPGARTSWDPGCDDQSRVRERTDESCRSHDEASRAANPQRHQSPRADELDGASRRADERERRQHGDLRGELGRLGGDEEGREQSDSDGVAEATCASVGDRLRVGDHEEQEDQDLRRGHEEPPEVPAGDRPDVPTGGHRVPAHCEQCHAGGEREPEAHRDGEQAEPREDRESTDDDDAEGERHPRRHRPPPEVERVRAELSEREEAHDEPEVRGIEDVPAVDLDHVLREKRDGRRSGEDPRAVQAPPVAVLRSGHAQDEGDAVAREERARGPHEDLMAKERDSDLEDGARPQGYEDLRDRQVEAERRLPEHLQRDDHGGEMKSWIADRRQQNRVLRSPDRQRRPTG